MAEPGSSGGGNGGGGGSSSPAWIKARTFGMPRYVFLGLVVVAIGAGLYLRSRARQADEYATEEEAVPSEEFGAMPADAFADAGDPGVLAGGAAGQVIPVTAPTIPEGYDQTFAGLGTVITDLGSAIADQGRQAPTVIVQAPKAKPKKKPPTKPKPQKPQKKQKPKPHAAAPLTAAPAPAGHWLPGHWANPNDKKHSHWVPARFVQG